MSSYFYDIEICNFRGIDHLKVDGLTSVNVLVGANNAGKTSVLEAIFMLSGMSNPWVPTRANYLRNSQLATIDGTRYLFHNLDFANRPLLKAKVDGGVRRLTFEAVLASSTDSSSSLLHSRSVIKRLEFDFGVDCGDDFPYHSTLFMGNNNDMQQTHDGSYHESLNCLFISANKGDDNAMTNFATLVRRNSKQLVIDALKGFDPSIETVEALPDGLYIKVSGVQELLPISMAGDGVRRMINIVATIANEDNNMVLIDELDNGLHYSAHVKMWRAMLGFALSHDIQLFVTTHNLDCLQGLKNAMQEDDRFKSLVNVYDIARTKENGYQAYKYSYEALKEAIDKEIEIRR